MSAETIALLRHLREIEPHSRSIVERCDAEIKRLSEPPTPRSILSAWKAIDWDAINHPQANAEADVQIIRGGETVRIK